MAEQLNNIQILDESGTLRGLNPNSDSLKITTPFEIGNDMKVGGDLTVNGDIISRGSTNVVSKDPVLDLGLGDYSGTAQAGGFTVQTNKASGFTALDVTAFQSKADASGDANFTVADASTLSVGMVVAITGASDGENDGYFVVKSKAGGVVSVEASFMGALPFAQTDFKTATGQTGVKVYNVDLAAVVVADGTILKKTGGSAYDAGTLVVAYIPAATKSLFEANGAYQAASDVTLDEAYQNGNTITTSAAKGGDVIIAGDQKLAVSASGGLQVSGGALDVNTSVDVDLTGAFTVDGAQNVTFGASTAVSTFTADASGAISLDAGAASNFTTAAGALTLSGAGGVTVTSTGGTLALNGAGQTVDLDATTLDVDGGSMSFDGTAFNLGVAAELPIDMNATTFDVDASGAVTLTGGAASKINTTAGDLTLDAEAASLILDGGEAAADAVKIAASNAAGGIDVDAGTAGITVNTTGGLLLDGAGLVDINAGANLDIDVTGTMDLDSTGAFSIDGTGASNVSATSGNLTLSTITSGDVIVTAVAKVDIDGQNVDIDATQAVSIQAAAASDFTVAGANLTLTTTGSGTVFVTAAGKIDADGTSVEINGTAASHFQVTGNDLLLQTITSGELDLTSAGLMDVNAGANLDIDVTGTFDLLASSTVSIAGTGNSKFEITSGNLAIETKTSGNITLDAIAGSLTMAGNGAVTLDSDTAGVSIGAVLASDFTVDASGESLTLEAKGGGAQQVKVQSAGTGVDALRFNASAGGIDIDAVGALTVDSASISLDATAASNLTVTGAGESLTLAAAGGGAQQLVASSAGTGADALRLNASAGGVDVDAEKAIALDAKLSSNLTVTANDAGPQGLTLKASNAGAGVSFVNVESDDGIKLVNSAGLTQVQRTSAGTILEVKESGNVIVQVTDKLVSLNQDVQFARSAGVKLQANASATVAAGTICAFDSSGKMIKADCAAGGNSPSAQNEVTRYPFAAAASQVSADAQAMFQTVPGTQVYADFDSAPTGGLVGQTVFLGTGANAGKVTLTAPTTSNASIWRVGILAGTTASNGLYPIFWHPQYMGRRPVA